MTSAREGKYTLSKSTDDTVSRSRLASLFASGSMASRNVLSLLSLNKNDDKRLPSNIADISYIPTPDISSQDNDCVLTVAADDKKENSTDIIQETKKTLQEDGAVRPQKSRRALTAGLEKLEKQNKVLQELCAKQRLDLDEATKDAAQAGRLSAVVFKLELEVKELQSKSGTRALQHIKTIDTSAQDAIRLATLSRKAAAAGEAADAAQQQLKEAQQLHDLKLSEIQQQFEACAAEKVTLQREAASNLAQASSVQQQLRDAVELHGTQQADLQQQLTVFAEEALTLERKAAAAQMAVDRAQEQLQHASEENRQQTSDLQRQLVDAMSQIHILKQEIESNSSSHAHELADQQQKQFAATAAAAKSFDSSMSALKAQHDDALTALHAQLANISHQHKTELVALKKQHEQQLDAIKQHHTQSVAAAQQKHQEQLATSKLQNEKTDAAARAESAQHTAAVSVMQSELCKVKQQLQPQESSHNKSRRLFEAHAVGPICVPAVERQCKGHEEALVAIQNALAVTQAHYAAARVHSLGDMSAFSAVQMQLHADLKQEADSLASAQSKLQQAHRQQQTLTSPLAAGTQQLPSTLSFKSVLSKGRLTAPELRSTADDNTSADMSTTASALVHCISGGSRQDPPGGVQPPQATPSPQVQPVHSSDAGHIISHASTSRQSQGAASPGFLTTACDSAKVAVEDLVSALQRHSCGEKPAKIAASGGKKESVKAVDDFLAVWADVKTRAGAFFANLDRVEKKFEAGRARRALRDEQECDRIRKRLEGDATESRCALESQPLTAVEDEQASADVVDYDSDDSWCIDDPTD